MTMPATIRATRWWTRRRWLPMGLRYRLARLLADPDRMASTPFTCDLAGLTWRGDLASYIDWHIYFLGAYEPGVLAFLRDAAQAAGSGAVFVDVGANVGQHSLFMSRHAAQVHAFEPWATARGRLEDALARNGVGNVTVHPVALGERDEELPFHAPSTVNLGTGSFVAGLNLNAPAGPLPVRRGDDALAALPRVDLIKIDTEGFELSVLRGLRDTIGRYRPVIVCEMSFNSIAELGPDPGAALPAMLLGDWTVFGLAERGDFYRLEPFAFPPGGQATAVLVPSEKLGLKPYTA